MPDVASSSKSNEKYLLIAAFVQGNNFPKKTRTKFLIEAKFDGEQLSTDPVEHNETIEINQELAWEIDKKNLQLHRLQRSCIKANCFAVNETTGTKENVGYVVLDVRSAPDGVQITKEIPLLQSKYQKQKPTLQCMIYTESDFKTASSSATALAGSINNSRPGSALSNPSIDEDTRDNIQPQSYSSLKSEAKLTVDDQHGRFKIGKTSNMQHNYVLTITLVFVQNLVKLLAQPPAANLSSSEFFFAFKFLNNQFTSKPFADIVSCQINVEKCSFRLLTSLADLKTFLTQNGPLEILFCSSTKILAKTSLNWDRLSLEIKDKNALMIDSPITVDQVLKLESSEGNSDRISPSSDIPVLGVQCSLERESSAENENDSNRHKAYGLSDNGDVPVTKKSGQSDVIYQNDTTTVTVENNPSTDNVILNVRARQLPESTIDENFMKFLTEEIQLKAAYELQIWKEQREKEFEANLKKREAKHFQTLADAFKQRDVERELMIQKKIKEYNELELLLKNSLNEVEKREKQLAFNESQIARLKADLHHDYETKLIEIREAAKRVQEKADHQLNLQKSKIESLEEEISKYRRQILELEKRYSDKETEFIRYKEREHNRPEIKLQSEINMLKLEKMELERKLDAQTKAKLHYKEQFMKTLQELALLKKRDEANTRAFLKKQQMELDQLKMRCLGNNDSSTTINGVPRKFQNETPFVNAKDTEINLGEYNIDSIDPALRQRINHLKEERECLMRTGAYSNTDDLIIELDRRIHDCLREAKITK